MKRFVLSTIAVVVMALSTTAFNPTAHAAAESTSRQAPLPGSDSRIAAPDCVHVFASWRYTQVRNDCSATHVLTVEYLQGGEVPCRLASPGDTITFPGYGTQGDQVLGAVLCAAGAGV